MMSLGRSKDNLQKSILSSVGPRDPIQVDSLDSKHLYPVSHLTGLVTTLIQGLTLPK